MKYPKKKWDLLAIERQLEQLEILQVINFYKSKGAEFLRQRNIHTSHQKKKSMSYMYTLGSWKKRRGKNKKKNKYWSSRKIIKPKARHQVFFFLNDYY